MRCLCSAWVDLFKRKLRPSPGSEEEAEEVKQTLLKSVGKITDVVSSLGFSWWQEGPPHIQPLKELHWVSIPMSSFCLIWSVRQTGEWKSYSQELIHSVLITVWMLNIHPLIHSFIQSFVSTEVIIIIIGTSYTIHNRFSSTAVPAYIYPSLFDPAFALCPSGYWDTSVQHICIMENILPPGERRSQLHLHIYYRWVPLICIPMEW